MTIGELIIYAKKNDLPLDTEIVIISNDLHTQGIYTSPSPNIESYTKVDKEFVNEFTYDRFVKPTFVISNKGSNDCLVLRG